MSSPSSPSPSSTDTARELLRALVERGVTDAVLAPGSRSAPLALALAAADSAGLLRLHVRVDEREAAFLALGLSRTSHRLVPVVTTSGTAVANLHPAMLEALHAGVGVLAVTADRPARLRGTGANQTTVQPGILPGVPEVQAVRDVAALAADAPAHLNLELDEPLVEPATDWTAGLVALPVKRRTRRAPDGPALVLAAGPRTVVLAGDDSGARARVLAREAGWPLLAEPTSGSRTGGALSTYRLLLGHEALAARVERVVSFGHPTLSRPVTRLLARADVDVVHVGTQATFPVPAGPRVTFVDDVAAGGVADVGWLQEWTDADARVQRAVDALLADHPDSGLAVARTVAEALPPDGLLVVGASQPIRDLDVVARPWTVGERRYVVANRGLAGIDGTVSTAVGAALARDSSRSLALMGDLTFLHGSNGLLVGPDEPRPDLTVVVVNDDGGAIFSTLEQGGPEHADAFERVFATPTGADLGALCAGYRVPHRRVEPVGLAAALASPTGGLEVVEVVLRRDGRRALDAALRATTATALADD
ncbi:2-succinyl-5-enolpyruvyl-6-hydroxy-3-cyclohexene-1-carboxylic-acid synthase [Aeromicrobium sp.]|uniref:2-succinyl-5-enolpyruvyl-6-hydroxy-3- cyclohexene-1-carboxylic-acid synthase n=1 Tax=Aeromicrobium sp. TaxID=1871063 RepID=UPI00351437F3